MEGLLKGRGAAFRFSESEGCKSRHARLSSAHVRVLMPRPCRQGWHPAHRVLALLIRMHPRVRRDLLRLGQPDHVNRRGVTERRDDVDEIVVALRVVDRLGPCNYTSFDETRLRLIARSEPRPGVGHPSDARGNHDIVSGRLPAGQLFSTDTGPI
jgi:hypothetical protein